MLAKTKWHLPGAQSIRCPERAKAQRAKPDWSTRIPTPIANSLNDPNIHGMHLRLSVLEGEPPQLAVKKKTATRQARRVAPSSHTSVAETAARPYPPPPPNTHTQTHLGNFSCRPHLSSAKEKRETTSPPAEKKEKEKTHKEQQWGSQPPYTQVRKMATAGSQEARTARKCVGGSPGHRCG
ncbi:hypothetical protein TbgDal_X11680 [Trypanosoma brucei gambiense DAL972]|uniref:Uncharacterized protein n=1 Tax=Trypanosoma brucei gambiense (strain MHOM/CI/86/DAL972) TaxID=679716 RepID=D0A479_TRYB9|nr:hypothetical protein TbgDal_X11680 [Trypanosoma brucei gambiense DAL972]CBH16073.1 hypothetical protein TbgDal_X11680 [Trypanosoma brucei gambiense DAL972]|eukprot:XP_011778337.1 hypothetical protein TbgDal_X11680 [Trypanosoma brucei gambiense DAL972]